MKKVIENFSLFIVSILLGYSVANFCLSFNLPAWLGFLLVFVGIFLLQKEWSNKIWPSLRPIFFGVKNER